MTQWEYKRVRLSTRFSEHGLNKLGSEGWELVGVWPEPSSEGRKTWAVFKRSVVEQPEPVEVR